MTGNLGTLRWVFALPLKFLVYAAVGTADRLIRQVFSRKKILLACAENKRLETITARKCLIFKGHDGYQESISIMDQIG
jgi:hypothetical protein